MEEARRNVLTSCEVEGCKIRIGGRKGAGLGLREATNSSARKK